MLTTDQGIFIFYGLMLFLLGYIAHGLVQRFQQDRQEDKEEQGQE